MMLNKGLFALACTALGTAAICLDQVAAKAATISVSYGAGSGIVFPGNGAVFQVGQPVNFRLDANWSASGTGPGNVAVTNNLVVGGATLSSATVYTDTIAGAIAFAASAFDQRFASFTFTTPGTYTAFGRLVGSINPTDSAQTSSVTFQVVAVPEPLTLLGAGTALGFGTFFKRELSKKQKKEKAKV